MNNTNFLGLKKPEASDYYNIEDQNTNSDLLDTAIKGHEDRISSIESDIRIENRLQSEVVVTQDHITSQPENTVDAVGGVEIVGMSGLSAVQLMKPVTDLDKWATSSGVLTVEDEKLVHTANNVTANPNLTSSSDGNRFPVKTDDKLFVYAKNRVTNSVCENIQTYVYASGGTASYLPVTYTPSQNIWYEQYGIVTMPSDMDSKDAAVYQRHSYPDTATADGKILEVSSILVVPLQGDLLSCTPDQLAFMARTSGLLGR